MRPRAFDGEVCGWCLGHQPAECPCNLAAPMPDTATRTAMANRSHGWSLIVHCSIAIDDPDADHAAAEGAFNTRARLAAKHGMPDPEWIAREREWLLPEYERRKESRDKFRHLDDAWREEHPLSGGLPPSYSAAILDDAAVAFGYEGYDAEISYEERFGEAPPLQP